jgi:hypothetical protein
MHGVHGANGSARRLSESINTTAFTYACPLAAWHPVRRPRRLFLEPSEQCRKVSWQLCRYSTHRPCVLLRPAATDGSRVHVAMAGSVSAEVASRTRSGGCASFRATGLQDDRIQLRVLPGHGVRWRSVCVSEGFLGPGRTPMSRRPPNPRRVTLARPTPVSVRQPAPRLDAPSGTKGTGSVKRLPVSVWNAKAPSGAHDSPASAFSCPHAPSAHVPARGHSWPPAQYPRRCDVEAGP